MLRRGVEEEPITPAALKRGGGYIYMMMSKESGGCPLPQSETTAILGRLPGTPLHQRTETLHEQAQCAMGQRISRQELAVAVTV